MQTAIFVQAPKQTIQVCLMNSAILGGRSQNAIEQFGRLEVNTREDGVDEILMDGWRICCGKQEPAIAITHDMLYILGLPYTFYMGFDPEQDVLAEEYDSLNKKR